MRPDDFDAALLELEELADSEPLTQRVLYVDVVTGEIINPKVHNGSR